MTAGEPGEHPLRAAVLPPGRTARHLEAAVRAGGLEPTADAPSSDCLVWCAAGPSGLGELLAGAPGLKWVQLPYAGVERFLAIMDDGRTWTCAKDVYGPPVAEFALGLLLAGLRRIDRYAAAREWAPLEESTLRGSTVAVLGAGGIGRALTAMLLPLGANVVVLSRSATPVSGATAAAATETLDVLPDADAVVLALPLTPATEGLVDRSFLAAMKRTAWLVNVARGRVVVTDDLVDALEAGAIGGAALDVTDPEPLPKGHRLWDLENAIVTPHVANTAALGTRALSWLVTENSRRFRGGLPLLGIVDPRLGY